jgi:hypothetical protein
VTDLCSTTAKQNAENEADTERRKGRGDWLFLDFSTDRLGVTPDLVPGPFAGRGRALRRFADTVLGKILQRRGERSEITSELPQLLVQGFEIGFGGACHQRSPSFAAKDSNQEARAL